MALVILFSNIFRFILYQRARKKKKKLVSPEIGTWPSKDAKKILKGTFQFNRGNDPITNSNGKDSPVKPEAHYQWEFPGRN